MNNILNDLTKQVMSQLIEARENQIIEKLKELGYSFDTRKELEQFAKTRCKLFVVEGSNIKTLLVDGVPLIEWNDKISLNREGDTFNATLG